jgi:hypothetical protein
LKILKQFQGLSERTANVGVYSLLELEPIEAVIDRNTLSLLGGIIRNKPRLAWRPAPSRAYVVCLPILRQSSYLICF